MFVLHAVFLVQGWKVGLHYRICNAFSSSFKKLVVINNALEHCGDYMYYLL
jgi:hypothetical protein